jgi:hypothetical protein
MIIFSLFLLIFLFWFPRPAELFFCFITGVIGLVLILMWVFSEHPEVKYNFNIIWCNPLYLVYIPLAIKNQSTIILAFVLFMTILSTFFIWIFNLQLFDIAIIPVLTILGLINFRRITRTGFNNVPKTRMP